MANATVLSSGMGLGFPAITLEALKDDNNPFKLNDDQASWFGEFALIKALSRIFKEPFTPSLNSLDKHFSISVGRDFVRNSIGSTR